MLATFAAPSTASADWVPAEPGNTLTLWTDLASNAGPAYTADLSLSSGTQLRAYRFNDPDTGSYWLGQMMPVHQSCNLQLYVGAYGILQAKVHTSALAPTVYFDYHYKSLEAKGNLALVMPMSGWSKESSVYTDGITLTTSVPPLQSLRVGGILVVRDQPHFSATAQWGLAAEWGPVSGSYLFERGYVPAEGRIAYGYKF
jgi:hypothetical protein